MCVGRRCVTADAMDGDNPNFLAGLEKRRQPWVAVAVRCDFAVGSSRRGGEVQRLDELIGAQPARLCRSVTWREGSRGWMRGQLCCLCACGGRASGPRRAGWLIGEDSSDGKRRYYWSNFGKDRPVSQRLVNTPIGGTGWSSIMRRPRGCWAGTSIKADCGRASTAMR